MLIKIDSIDVTCSLILEMALYTHNILAIRHFKIVLRLSIMLKNTHFRKSNIILNFLLIRELIQLKESPNYSELIFILYYCMWKKSWFLNLLNHLLHIYLIWPFGLVYGLSGWKSLKTTSKNGQIFIRSTLWAYV